MAKILFICSGNVGRSQMAEAYYNHFTKSDDAFSAGTKPGVAERYQKLPDDIVKLMNEEGIDVTSKKVKLVTPEMVERADRIIILCENNLCPDFLLSSGKNTFWQVQDPNHLSFGEMRKIRDLIKSKVLSLCR